jgi:hypothetical protein
VADQYYIRSRGKVQGPFTVDKLRQLASQGRFARHFEVSADGNSWSLAGNLPGLFPTPTERKVRANRVSQPVPATERIPLVGETSDPDFGFDPAFGNANGAAESTQEWHYIQNGASQGPISFADMRSLAAGGQLVPTDFVWSEGMDEWVPAMTIPQLFPQTAARAANRDTTQFAADGPIVRTSSLAIASMIMGIVGIVILPCSILAIIFGHIASRDIARSQGTLEGRTMAVVGMVFGYIVVGIAFVVAVVVSLLLFTAVGAAVGHH